MKYLIKFTYYQGSKAIEVDMRVDADDARHALTLLEPTLDMLGATSVESITPLP
jgi:hypothetical protein